MARPKRPSAEDLPEQHPSKIARHANQVSGNASSQTTVPHGSQPSVAYSSTPPSSVGPASQLPPSSSLVYLDENDDDENVMSTGQDSAPLEFYGTTENKIVGVRYYNGLVTPGESVICRREPSNPYDHNAIRVDNILGAQIGHLPRNLASRLATYMDSNGIVLEGVLNGPKGYFDSPVRLYLYGPSDASTRLALEERLKKDKLLTAIQLKNTRKEAEARRAAALKVDKGERPLGLGSSELGSGQDLALQELLDASESSNFRPEVDSIDTIAMDEETMSKMPSASQPSALESKLLPYQLQGLAWMIAKESPQLPSPGSTDITQLWKRDKGDNFLNLLSGHVTTTRPQLLSGGLLSDDMGLGKTIQVISLIMKSGFRDGPTLIISPVSVMSNWEQQFSQHVKKDQMPRILRYHQIAGGKIFSAAEFKKYDVVITTYGRLASNLTISDKKGLFSLRWRRVILDEGHTIRNATTKTAKAACNLQAQSRWLLSGTPIVNSVADFHSALMFLQITGGAEQKVLFAMKITNPLQAGGEEGERATKLLRSLVQELCLRRKKDMKFVNLSLPEKKERTYHVALTKEEQDNYDALMTKAQGALQDYRKERKNGKGKGSKKSKQKPEVTFAHVLEQLLRLRQMCCHWSLCGSRVAQILEPLDDQDIVELSDQNREILQAALQEAINGGEECPVCYDAISLHDPVITKCKHRFGKICITKALERKADCPMCRATLTTEDFIELDLKDELQEEDEHPEFDSKTRSSKTEAIEWIVRTHLKDPKSKVIIFSQWTSFLNVIENVLVEDGMNCRRIDGSMSTKLRDAAMMAINTDPEARILLASLSVSSVGLNLTGADTVIFADCWWAPAIEDQAIDRVHRIGQKRPVNVYKVVVDASVEQRVLAIQDKKRQLVAQAFQDESQRRFANETRVGDVEKLLA